MLKDITLGQFFPGTSLLHRLDPRTKIVAVIFFVASLFISSSFIGYGFCFAFLAWCIKISGISPKMILKSLKPIVIILAFTGLLNMFYTPGEVLVTYLLRVTASLRGLMSSMGMARFWVQATAFSEINRMSPDCIKSLAYL